MFDGGVNSNPSTQPKASPQTNQNSKAEKRYKNSKLRRGGNQVVLVDTPPKPSLQPQPGPQLNLQPQNAKPEKRYKHSKLHARRTCNSCYHRSLTQKWSNGIFEKFDFVLYCHLRYEKCPQLHCFDPKARARIEQEMILAFLGHFQAFSQQWRMLRAYAFGRFWQVKTGGVEFLRTVKRIIECRNDDPSRLNPQLSQVCQMIAKTLEWNEGFNIEPPWIDCNIHDPTSLTKAFEKSQTSVSLIKYVYHAYVLHLEPESLDINLIQKLFELLTSQFTVRDIWLVLGYHLAGCFWGDKEGCVGYLEYFTQCVYLLNLQDNPNWAVKFTQLLSLVHGLAYQNRAEITKSLREGFTQNFDVMNTLIHNLCNWHETARGTEMLYARCNCRKRLKEVIVPLFTGYSIVEYGSTRLHLDLEDSDLDIALVPYKLRTPDNINSMDTIRECKEAQIPSADRARAVTMIDAIQQVLKSNDIFSDVVMFANARVPLLRCKYVNQVTVDISVHSNEHLFSNIMTLWDILDGQTALQTFLVAIKCWAKKFGLVRPFHGTINSHGWTMLTIFTWKLLSHNANMRGVSAGECFVKFFRLFRDFNYETDAISIHELCFVPKQEAVILEFEGLYGQENVCRHVTQQGAELIFRSIRFTDRYLSTRPVKDVAGTTFQSWLETLKSDSEKQIVQTVQAAPGLHQWMSQV